MSAVILPRDALWTPPSGPEVLRDSARRVRRWWLTRERDRILEAVGTPTSLGSTSANTSATTLVLTVTANVSIGQQIFAFGGCETAASTATFSDSGGNTWATNKTANTTQNACAFLGSTRATTALTSGVSTITVTYSAARTLRVLAAAQASGIATSTPFDQSAVGNGNTTGVVSWATAASGALAMSDELAWAVCCNNAAAAETQTPQGSPSTFTEMFDFASAGAMCMYVNYLVCTTTGAVTGQGQMTNSGGRAWNGLVGTYKGVAAGGPVVKALAALGVG